MVFDSVMYIKIRVFIIMITQGVNIIMITQGVRPQAVQPKDSEAGA